MPAASSSGSNQVSGYGLERGRHLGSPCPSSAPGSGLAGATRSWWGEQVLGKHLGLAVFSEV